MNNNNTKYKCASLGKVKKLAYIVTLDNMLKSYDGLKKQDEEAIAKSGSSVSILTDAIIEKLTNLVNSERTLTCRNVLIANYETMTNPQYWLNRKLFADLPKADSYALQKKIRQMVDLMAALAMKIFQLGESHSEAFFKKLMKSYEASQNTPYKIWKSRQLRLTMKKYKQYQAELTADILNLGIMDHDDEPTDEERAAVRLDLLKMEMSHGKKLSDNFIDAAAKLRRYSYWDGHKFMIDYPIAKQYLYRIFDKLTNDQRIALYYYNVQMIQLHQDMDELHQEEPSASTYMPSSESQEDRIRSFFNKQDDRTQQAWLREAMKALMGVTDHTGKAIFWQKQHWMGVYLVLRDRLGVRCPQTGFAEYAQKITPLNCPDNLKIGQTTMTNFSKLVIEDKPYFEMKHNPFEEVCKTLWDIIFKQILTKI